MDDEKPHKGGLPYVLLTGMIGLLYCFAVSLVPMPWRVAMMIGAVFVVAFAMWLIVRRAGKAAETEKTDRDDDPP
jgi:cyanate permease